jgi:fused signal recognition particle receptor
MGLLKSIFTSEKKKRLDEGLAESKKSFFSKMKTAVAGKSKIDIDLLDELEEVLIRSDVGVATTIKIIEALELRVSKDKYIGTEELNEILRDEITLILLQQETKELTNFNAPLPNSPHVIMVVGVNGVGKTTTIGKLSHHFKQGGKKVILGAADTDRKSVV